ncbi:igf2 mRNA binding protein [Culex quinquefasciatus]|uniref:Igf2 mRNA binding protein n=1 Tax=Culex quinquefasciatus TaxID=7176 RepID=B0WJP8_CULQU|nr:igf2 mRNA binding protein [Culex quinquefasciatus]|eukprot:XP_001848932.1 igf2 mRNA binding protein [Culex quinquefasciatus]
MREDGFVSGTDDVRFTVEILVPSAQVGRIIGKGGQNVRELQRVTVSIIKQPEHTAAMHVHTSHVEKIMDCIQIEQILHTCNERLAVAACAGSHNNAEPKQPHYYTHTHYYLA